MGSADGTAANTKPAAQTLPPPTARWARARRTKREGRGGEGSRRADVRSLLLSIIKVDPHPPERKTPAWQLPRGRRAIYWRITPASPAPNLQHHGRHRLGHD